VRFENISNGEVNLETNGIAELKEQAGKAKNLFSERQQTVTGFTFTGDEVETEIEYTGILATDLPNGLKAGDKIELKGKSIFRFKDNKIIGLTDIS
ncbi:MAG: nuclear transport factor 2 family protein, partial [Sphingobacteriales bacterium]